MRPAWSSYTHISTQQQPMATIDQGLQRVRTLGGTRWAGGDAGPVPPSQSEIAIAWQSSMFVTPDTRQYAAQAFRLLDPNNDGCCNSRISSTHTCGPLTLCGTCSGTSR